MAEYFSHDYDTREDEKIIDLLSDLGYEGYGIYWAIIEMLYKNKGSMQSQYNRIAFALKADAQTVEKVIKDYRLFQFGQINFWSESVKSRLKMRKERSEKARQSAFNRWHGNDANAMRTQSDCNANKRKKEIKKINSDDVDRILNKEDYKDPKYISRPK